MVSFKTALFTTLAVFFINGSQYIIVAANNEAAQGQATGAADGKPAETKPEDKEAKERAAAAKKTDDAVMDLLVKMLVKDGSPNAYDVTHAIVSKAFAKLDQEKDKEFIADKNKALNELKDKLNKQVVALKERAAQLKTQQAKQATEGEAAKEEVKEARDIINDIADYLKELKDIADEVNNKALDALKGDDKKNYEHEIFKVKAKYVNDKCDAIARLFNEAGNEVNDENIKKLLSDLNAQKAEVNKHKLEVDRVGDDVDPVKNFQTFKDEAKKHGEKAGEVVDALVKHRDDKKVEFDNDLYNNIKEFVDVVISTSKAYFPALAFTLLLSAVLF